MSWFPCGETDTWKSIPASAELLVEPLVVICLELTVTSVSSPITAEGLMTNTLPLPLLVLIPAFALPIQPVRLFAGREQVPELQVDPELLP